MPLSRLRRSYFSRVIQISALLLLSFSRQASADPIVDYQSWIWETGVFGANELSEETCFGSYVITFNGDLTWALPSTTVVDVCW